MSARLNIAFQIVRIILILILAMIFIISTIYFIRAIDAIGDDVDEAKETHWGHEVEDSPLFEEKNQFNPYEYEDGSDGTKERNRASPRGRLIVAGENHYFGVTKSRDKKHHIVSLIVWVVLTLFSAILSLAGIIGALCLNPCMVLFSACMVAVHTAFSHVLPRFEIQLPKLTSNWLLLVLEVSAILLAFIFIALFRARQKAIINKSRQRNLLY